MQDDGGSGDDGDVPQEQQVPAAIDVKEVVRKARPKSRKAQSQFEKRFQGEAIVAEKDYAHLRGLIDHYKHKGIWSYYLMAIMLIMVIFQCLLLWKVGKNSWDFSKYTWLLPALLVQNLAQIVGLAVFVVKALFKNLDDQ